MKLFDYLKKAHQNSIRNKIILTFYVTYPEKPYISENRKVDWIERAAMFPDTSIVPKAMMKRNADGLLPGHVYMLYWLKRYTDKKVPAYFEYKYGIDFEKERAFLLDNGFLDSMNKPTEKGEKVIEKYNKVIVNHTPKIQDVSIEGISKQIRKQRDSIRRNGFDGYVFIANRNCCPICAALDGRSFPISKFKIGVNAPPMHEKCSCSIAACDDADDYEEWLDFIDKGGSTKQYKSKRKR